MAGTFLSLSNSYLPVEVLNLNSRCLAFSSIRELYGRRPFYDLYIYDVLRFFLIVVLKINGNLKVRHGWPSRGEIIYNYLEQCHKLLPFECN